MNQRISNFTKLLLFCSGATYDIVITCPRFEINKYASIGMAVLLTAILSVISSFFAFLLIFDSPSIALPIAIFWGLIIFNLDRFLVSTMRTSDSKWKDFIKAVPRIIIAILIAVVITKPLEIKLFSKEISKVLETERMDMIYLAETKYKQELILLDSKKDKINQNIEKNIALRDQYYDEYKCECLGTCGTKVKGYGKECESRKSRYEQFLIEFTKERQRTDSLFKNLASQELKIKRLIDMEQEQLASIQTYGLFDQIRALHKLDNIASFFIILIFGMIEIAPLIAKILTKKGPYDNLILEHELKYEIDYLKQYDIYDQERIKNKKMMEMATHLEVKSKEVELNDILRQDAIARYEKMRNQIDYQHLKN